MARRARSKNRQTPSIRKTHPGWLLVVGTLLITSRGDEPAIQKTAPIFCVSDSHMEDILRCASPDGTSIITK